VGKVRDNAVNQINVELSLEFKFVILWLRILHVKYIKNHHSNYHQLFQLQLSHSWLDIIQNDIT
jgi:hypothetical protein